MQTYSTQQVQAIRNAKFEDRNTVGHTPSVENGLWVSQRLSFWIDLTIQSSDASLIAPLYTLLMLLLLALLW